MEYRDVYPWDMNKDKGYYLKYYQLEGDKLTITEDKPRWARGSWRYYKYPIQAETTHVIDMVTGDILKAE